MGHAEYQTREGLTTFFIVLQMTLSVLIIIFSQFCNKAYIHHWRLMDLDEIHSSAFQTLEEEKDSAFVRVTYRVFQTLTRSRVTINAWRQNIYGFLPVSLIWILRVSVGVFAYMYNSYVGLFHLIWVIISFLIPTSQFYFLSCYMMFPIVISEFSLFYVANIKSYNNARLYSHPVIEEFLFHPKKPFFELCLIYSIVIFVGMMFPARLRLQHFL